MGSVEAGITTLRGELWNSEVEYPKVFDTG